MASIAPGTWRRWHRETGHQGPIHVEIADMNRRSAFTLIELLVVISVISILIGLLMPALAASRESSRQLKCLTNLKGLGVGINLYLQGEARGLFPYVQIQEDDGDATLLDVLADYVDAPTPRKDDDGVHYIVADPYRCPSDIGDPDPDIPQSEPVWYTNGSSYDYLPGVAMIAAESFIFDKDRATFAVTRAYEADRNWPFLTDAIRDKNGFPGWHRNRSKSAGPQQNALYFPDWRADWSPDLTGEDWESFFVDVSRFGGGPL
jgi:prepilin-type N-terminal cleavage/methylation domain-containing protein